MPTDTGFSFPTEMIVFGLLFYAYFSAMLMIVARKTQTPNAWMAWVPIANLFLMCSIGRRSAGLVLLMLIPFVNVIVLAMLWVAIAKARGKPGWTGVLILVPLVGLLVPAYFAMGEAAQPVRRTGPARADQVGTTSQPGVSPKPKVCSNCGTSAEPGEAFCGNCGQKLPTAVVAEPKPVEKKSGAGAVIAVVLIALVIGGGWFVYRSFASYTPPDRVAPALPSRMAGTLTEFPVDTDPTSPVRPTSVISQNFQQKGRGRQSEEVKVPQEWLPPGINSSNLPRRVNTVTSTQYRGVGPMPPVNVHVMESSSGRATGERMANEVTRATGGRRTGVRVESPTGNVYSGSRIQTPQTVVFILVNQGTDNVVIIYAPEPSVADVAVRLAGNVGNGEGLNDYPEVRNSLWTLPPRPPEGLMLQEANTLTRGDFERSLGELESAVGDGGGAGVQQLLSRVRQFIPERLTAARYTDRRQQAWNVVVGDYQSPGRAWTIWMMLRGLLSVSGLGASSVPGGDGLYATVEDGRMMALQKGPYIVVLGGPTSAPIDRLMGLAQLFQL